MMPGKISPEHEPLLSGSSLSPRPITETLPACIPLQQSPPNRLPRLDPFMAVYGALLQNSTLGIPQVAVPGS